MRNATVGQGTQTIALSLLVQHMLYKGEQWQLQGKDLAYLLHSATM